MAKNDANGGSKGFMDWFKSPQTDEKSEKEGVQTNEALLKNIEGLTKRLDEAERRAAEASAPVAGPAPGAEDVPEAPMLDLSNLPDPFLEPERYSKEYSKRNQDFLTATVAFERQRGQSQAQFDAQFQAKAGDLWEDFQGVYPEYAKKPRLVSFAAAEVAQRIANQGKDVQAYMFGQRTQFMKEVVKEIDGINGPLKAEPATDDDEGADRTDGLFGGSTPAAKDTGEGKSDMVSDLRSIQTSLKLY